MAEPRSRPTLLLADDSATPRVRLAWTSRDGEARRFAGDRQYGTDNDRTELAPNIDCYVALGGVRLSKVAGHPDGVIVRVGFYKQDPWTPMFDGIDHTRPIEVVLAGLRFNQPVDPNPNSPVQHLKYATEALASCGMPAGAREQFNTLDPTDTLNDRTVPGVDARLGVLGGAEDALGRVVISEEEDGSLTMRAVFEYAILRNLRDPWKSTLPGTFLEPVHFHIEFEVLPEGVEPLDTESLRERNREIRDRIDREGAVTVSPGR